MNFRSKQSRLLLLVILPLMVIFHSESTHAQIQIKRLECEGEMPWDFKFRFSDANKDVIKKASFKSDNIYRHECAVLNAAAIDYEMQNGRVVYGDPVTRYCNRLLDSLLKKKPDLRSKIRVYTWRTNRATTLSTGSGVILISTGLIARLDNESQLAFLLAHEVGHFVMKDNVDFIEIPQEDSKAYQPKMVDHFYDYVLDLNKYVKNAELDADVFAWELYVEAGYSSKEVKPAIDKLYLGDRPLAEVDFRLHYNYLGKYQLPGDLRHKLNFESGEQRSNDHQGNHPHLGDRKSEIKSYFDFEKHHREESRYLLDPQAFEQMVKACKREAVFNHIHRWEYASALMLCDAWKEQKVFEPKELALLRAGFLYNIQRTHKAKEEEQFEPVLPWEKKQVEKTPSLSGYEKAFSLFTKKEVNIFILREMWKIHDGFPQESELKELFYWSLFEFKQKTVFYSDYFDLDPISDSTETNEEGKDWECSGCKGAFASKPFQKLFQVTFKEAFPSRYEPREFKNQGTPKVNRLLVLNPRYFNADNRKTTMTIYERSDKRRQLMEEGLKASANDLGIELVIPDSKAGSGATAKQFNQYARLIEWMQEQAGSNHKQYFSFFEADLKDIRKDYGTDYLAVVYMGNQIEKRETNLLYCAVSLAIPYLLPAYLYWQFKPKADANYMFYMLDLKYAKLAYSDVRDYKNYYRKHLIRSHIYNSLNQIKK